MSYALPSQTAASQSLAFIVKANSITSEDLGLTHQLSYLKQKHRHHDS